jgi:hypothetical protein
LLWIADELTVNEKNFSRYGQMQAVSRKWFEKNPDVRELAEAQRAQEKAGGAA